LGIINANKLEGTLHLANEAISEADLTDFSETSSKGLRLKNLEVQQDFEIFGELGEEWEEFRKDIDYEAFLVKCK
jgi:hypothetical protein